MTQDQANLLCQLDPKHFYFDGFLLYDPNGEAQEINGFTIAHFNAEGAPIYRREKLQAWFCLTIFKQMQARWKELLSLTGDVNQDLMRERKAIQELMRTTGAEISYELILSSFISWLTARSLAGAE